MEQIIGHVLVQSSKADDAAYYLGVEDWAAHFDVLPVSQDIWNTFEKLRLWQNIDEACGCLIDRYEEEWIAPEALPGLQGSIAAFHRDKSDKLGPSEIEFLSRLAAQTHRAICLAVPVIFSLD